MFGKPMIHERYANELPLVSSSNRNDPNGLFSLDIFGNTGTQQSEKAALISLNCYVMRPNILDVVKRFKRIIYDAVIGKDIDYHQYCVYDGEIKKTNDPDLEGMTNEEIGDVGYGPRFIHRNWDKLKFERFVNPDMMYSNAKLKIMFKNYTIEEVFQKYEYVIPLAFRREETEGGMIYDPQNAYYAELIRLAKSISLKTGLYSNVDIETRIQLRMLERYNELSDQYYGSKGQLRQLMLSRSIDNSSRMVILPVVYSNKIIGKSKIGVDSFGVPIQHLISNFRDFVVKYSKDFITELHARGMMPNLPNGGLLMYDVQTITKYISSMEDTFFRTQAFPIIIGQKEEPLIVEYELFENNNWKKVRKKMAFIEFFYIVLTTYMDVSNRRRMTTTRYPIDAVTSIQTLRPIPLTILPDKQRIVKFMDIEYDDFPWIDEEIDNNFQEKIFEQASRLSPSHTVSVGGDHDGDSMQQKPLLSEEATKDGERSTNALLHLFDYAGSFKREIGKSSTQSLYTMSRDPRPSDKTKVIPVTHPFIKYILELKKGEINLDTLYSHTCSFKDDEEPELSLYDTVNIIYRNEKIKTTLGRLILNKVFFDPVWEHQYFDYINETMYMGVLTDAFKTISHMISEKKIDFNPMNRIVDIYTEFTLRVSTMYNSSITDKMIAPREEFMKKRDAIMLKYRDRILKDNDIALLDEMEKEMIKEATNYFKEDEMHELYESKGKAKFGNDYKNMVLTMGALPNLTGGKPKIILESLADGISNANMPSFINSGLFGAYDRSNKTALGGAARKYMSNAFQNVFAKIGDCGSRKGIKMRPTKRDEIYHKYVIENGTTTLITLDNYKKYLNKDIEVRDPFFCRAKNDSYCSHCTGLTPFDMSNRNIVIIGLLIVDIANAEMNAFMKSTHDMSQHAFIIKDLNKYLYPNQDTKLFESRYDEVDKVMKIHVLEDLDWVLPTACVSSAGEQYKVLAHGSVMTYKNAQYSLGLGTEILSSPDEVLSPSSPNNPHPKHFVFKYKKGSAILNSDTTYESMETVHKMINLFLSGGATNLIPLETHMTVLENTFATNKRISASTMSFNIMLSTLARDINDISKPARETGSKDYKFIGTGDLVTIQGTFSSMLGPDAGRGIAVSMGESRQIQERRVSPLEEVVI